MNRYAGRVSLLSICCIYLSVYLEYEDGDWTDMLDGSAYPEIFSPGGCITKDINSVSPRISRAVSPKVILLITILLKGVFAKYKRGIG